MDQLYVIIILVFVALVIVGAVKRFVKLAIFSAVVIAVLIFLGVVDPSILPSLP